MLEVSSETSTQDEIIFNKTINKRIVNFFVLTFVISNMQNYIYNNEIKSYDLSQLYMKLLQFQRLHVLQFLKLKF